MLKLGLGIQGCTKDCAKFFDPNMYQRLSALLRIGAWFATGLHFVGIIQMGTDSEGERLMAQHLLVGPEVRGIYRFRQLEVWSGLFIGYVHHQTKMWDMGTPQKSTLTGFALGWGLGLDYYFTRIVALGINLWIYKPVYRKLCINDECTSAISNKGVGIHWSVGPTLTIYLGR